MIPAEITTNAKRSLQCCKEFKDEFKTTNDALVDLGEPALQEEDPVVPQTILARGFH